MAQQRASAKRARRERCRAPVPHAAASDAAAAAADEKASVGRWQARAAARREEVARDELIGQALCVPRVDRFPAAGFPAGAGDDYYVELDAPVFDPPLGPAADDLVPFKFVWEAVDWLAHRAPACVYGALAGDAAAAGIGSANTKAGWLRLAQQVCRLDGKARDEQAVRRLVAAIERAREHLVRTGVLLRRHDQWHQIAHDQFQRHRALHFVALDAFARRWSPTVEQEADGKLPGDVDPYTVVLTVRLPLRYVGQWPGVVVLQQWHRTTRVLGRVTRYLGLAPVLSPDAVPIGAHAPRYDTRDLEVVLLSPTVACLPVEPDATTRVVDAEGDGSRTRTVRLLVLRLSLERVVPPPVAKFARCDRCRAVDEWAPTPPCAVCTASDARSREAWRAAAYGAPPLAWVWRERFADSAFAALTGLSVTLNLEATRRLHLFRLDAPPATAPALRGAAAPPSGRHRGVRWCPLPTDLRALVLGYLP